MMGGRMEDETHLGIRVKLTTGFPSSAGWDSWDVRQCFGDG
jgi:hypothetical protein